MSAPCVTCQTRGRRLTPLLIMAIVLLGAASGDSDELEGAPEPRYYLPLTDYLPQGPDWSNAGYDDSGGALPYPGVKYNVVDDFGATGDGLTDDSGALQAAVAAANSEPGVVLLPAGTYRLSQPLEIVASGVVLRGEGESKTRIVITQSLADVYPGTWSDDGQGNVTSQWTSWGGFLSIRGTPEYQGTGDTWLAGIEEDVKAGSSNITVDSSNFTDGDWVRVFATSEAGREVQLSARVASSGDSWLQLDRPLPFPVTAGQGSVHSYAPSVQDSGIEKLTIEFSSPGTYGGPNTDRGYNAIFLLSAANVWVQQVTVLNADTAVLLHRVDHGTVNELTIGTTESRANPTDLRWKRQGHSGVVLADCHGVLVQRFNISSRFYRDLAVTDSSLLNVFTGGTAYDLSIDSSTGSLANLFSDIKAGLGERLFPPEGGAPGPYTTFFNIRTSVAEADPSALEVKGSRPASTAVDLAPSCPEGEPLNFFGSFHVPAAASCPDWRVVPLNDSLPTDLYSEQVFARRSAALPAEGAERSGPDMARTACRTFMGSSSDPLQCWVLLYDHCIPGYTNRNAIPRDILDHERQVVDELYDAGAPYGSFGEPPDLLRAEYSRVCMANADLAGSGDCGRVEAGNYRIHMAGFRPKGAGECDHVAGETSYVKAHMDKDHNVETWGNVGH